MRDRSLPAFVTPAIVLVCLWVAFASGRIFVDALPAALAAALAVADYRLWVRRGRPWHDAAVIVLLLPALGCGVWIAIGSLVLEFERTDHARLILEVGPGIALVGLLCTLISYHGRHHPDEPRGGRR